MIDRVARKQAAEVIRHFVSGQITNDEFIRRYPSSKHDPVIWALDDTMWCLYDDIATHKLAGEYAPSKDFKKQVARWLAFLYSDEEYLWPRIDRPGFRSNAESLWLSWIFGFGQRRLRRFMASGDYEVWPFTRREDFEKICESRSNMNVNAM